jgi:hypothetical protein
MPPRNLMPVESLRQEKPAKLIKLIGLAWPEIEAALQQGHTLRRIHQRLAQSGIPISYSLLTVYVKRIRLEAAARDNKPAPAPLVNAHNVERDRPGTQPKDWQPQSIEGNREESELTYSGFFKEGVPNVRKLTEGID